MSILPEPAPIIAYTDRQRLFNDEFLVAATAILIYDYILTLQLEINHIWLSKWTSTKFVFLLVRYSPFVFTPLILQHQIAVDAPVDFCRVTYPVAMWMMQVNNILSEVVFAFRTWAIWHRNRMVGVGLTIVMIAFVVTTLVFVSETLKVISYENPLYPGFRGCLVVGDTAVTSIILYQSTSTCTAQAILLVLVAISAFKSYKSGHHSELSYVIHRDGIMIYVYMLGITMGTLFIVLTKPPDMVASFAPMGSIMYSVVVTRTILNIRNATTRTTRLTTTELHAVHEYLKPDLRHPTAISTARHSTDQARDSILLSSFDVGSAI